MTATGRLPDPPGEDAPRKDPPRTPERFPKAGSAERLVSAAPAEAYRFLAHLPNHHLISDRHLRLMSLAADHRGGVVEIRGPLGLRRTARTRVTRTFPPHDWGGEAAIGDRILAHVDWHIAPHPGGCRAATTARISLTVRIARAGVADRILLRLARPWLVRRLGGWLRSLDAAVTVRPGP